MRSVFHLLERAAASDATVLLLGETGTGKELTARSLHRTSARAEGPFVVVDCGALPGEILESELFGHERGAFTGAVHPRVGAFEAAHGGTVFLDEVGELDIDLQPKLLRVLESRCVRRVGSNEQREIDVRVIAATNRDLREEVNAKRFRSDLYYRLAVVDVTLPPLRDRPEDIPLLVEHLLTGTDADEDAAGRVREPAFLARLAGHHWPGNVRELRNHLERYVALGEERPPQAADRRDVSGDPDIPLKEARRRWTVAFERSYLERAVDAHDGNITAAARAAGVDRAYFYRLLWKHGLR